MKLSRDTLNLLKNFSTINQSILIEPGNKLKTVSVNKAMMGNATVEDTFPSEFGVYDLPGFISVLSVFADPELIFESKYVSISGDGSVINYYYTDKSLLSYSDKEISLSAGDVLFEFGLTKEDLDTLIKAAAVLALEYIKCSVVDGKVVMSVVDVNGDNANSFVKAVGEADDVPGEVFLKTEFLKFMEGDYKVRVGKLGGSTPVMELLNDNIDLSYFVALDAKTTI